MKGVFSYFCDILYEFVHFPDRRYVLPYFISHMLLVSLLQIKKKPPVEALS